MVVVSLYVETYASMRPSFLHEIGSKTMKSDIASQPVFTSYKLLEIERLTLGVRVLTVMEFVLRHSLHNDQAKLPGLHPENRTKMTDTPTAERLLKAFSDVSLTIVKTAAGEEILRRLTPLSTLQQEILRRLGLGTSLYWQLEIHNIGN